MATLTAPAAARARVAAAEAPRRLSDTSPPPPAVVTPKPAPAAPSAKGDTPRTNRAVLRRRAANKQLQRLLAERYPKLFTWTPGEAQPLAIGIHLQIIEADLALAAPGAAIDPRRLARFLGMWTARVDYRDALAAARAGCTSTALMPGRPFLRRRAPRKRRKR